MTHNNLKQSQAFSLHFCLEFKTLQQHYIYLVLKKTIYKYNSLSNCLTFNKKSISVLIFLSF